MARKLLFMETLSCARTYSSGSLSHRIRSGAVNVKNVVTTILNNTLTRGAVVELVSADGPEDPEPLLG